MMPEIFHAKTQAHVVYQGPKRYVRIFLYETGEELREAAGNLAYTPLDPERNRTVGLYSPPFQRFKYAKDGSEVDLTDKHYGGLIRLCKDHLTAEIIAHECVHAACAIYRLDITKSVVLWTHCNEREEQFAYLLGNLIDNVMWELRDYYKSYT